MPGLGFIGLQTKFLTSRGCQDNLSSLLVQPLGLITELQWTLQFSLRAPCLCFPSVLVYAQRC